jgi:predicted amidohydrolase
MTGYNWTEITRDDVLKAIQKFLSDQPAVPEPRNTFLLYEDRKLPAKHIRGMAYFMHYGKEIRKSEFGGGMETVSFFKRLGFDVFYAGSIVHGQQSSEKEKDPIKQTGETTPLDAFKVCMYLQTEEFKDQKSFEQAADIIRNASPDIVVFPEFSYFAGVDLVQASDILNEDDQQRIFETCLSLSQSLGTAVVVNTNDTYGSINSIYANAFASPEETQCRFYMKHTMTDSSIFDLSNYQEFVQKDYYQPIVLKGKRIGLTICYDCNHAIFSRIFSLCGGVDILLNSTGGDVIFDKWFKYNKARAIENHCFNLVTMGGNGETGKNYVYGLNPAGGSIMPVGLNVQEENVPGGLYLYSLTQDLCKGEPDLSNPVETINKHYDLEIDARNIMDVLSSADRIARFLYRKKVGNLNVIFLQIDGMDIMKPEIVQKLLYSDAIKPFCSRRYVILNQHSEPVEEHFFKEQLSVILKVRAMENFCAVVYASDSVSKCYQTGKNRTAQVLKPVNGKFQIDLSRTTGPESIWKNKEGMRASWRRNYEWLIHNAG